MADSFTRRAALKLPTALGLGALFSKLQIGDLPDHKPGLVPVTPSTWKIVRGSVREPGEWKTAKRALDLLRLKNERRIDGLDPDLAALKSVSPAMKRHIQMARIAARYDWIENLSSAANEFGFFSSEEETRD